MAIRDNALSIPSVGITEFRLFRLIEIRKIDKGVVHATQIQTNFSLLLPTCWLDFVTRSDSNFHISDIDSLLHHKSLSFIS